MSQCTIFQQQETSRSNPETMYCLVLRRLYPHEKKKFIYSLIFVMPGNLLLFSATLKEDFPYRTAIYYVQNLFQYRNHLLNFIATKNLVNYGQNNSARRLMVKVESIYLSGFDPQVP